MYFSTSLSSDKWDPLSVEVILQLPTPRIRWDLFSAEVILQLPNPRIRLDLLSVEGIFQLPNPRIIKVGSTLCRSDFSTSKSSHKVGDI